MTLSLAWIGLRPITLNLIGPPLASHLLAALHLAWFLPLPSLSQLPSCPLLQWLLAASFQKNLWTLSLLLNMALLPFITSIMTTKTLLWFHSMQRLLTLPT